jgi:hypothetical protein
MSANVVGLSNVSWISKGKQKRAVDLTPVFIDFA